MQKICNNCFCNFCLCLFLALSSMSQHDEYPFSCISSAVFFAKSESATSDNDFIYVCVWFAVLDDFKRLPRLISHYDTQTGRFWIYLVSISKCKALFWRRQKGLFSSLLSCSIERTFTPPQSAWTPNYNPPFFNSWAACVIVVTASIPKNFWMVTFSGKKSQSPKVLVSILHFGPFYRPSYEVERIFWTPKMAF